MLVDESEFFTAAVGAARETRPKFEDGLIAEEEWAGKEGRESCHFSAAHLLFFFEEKGNI